MVVMKFTALGPEIQSGHPQARALGEGSGIIIGEASGKNSHHDEALSIDRNWLPDKCRVAAVAFLPEPVAQDCCGIPSYFFFRQKQPTAQRVYAQNGKQIRGDVLAGDLFGLVLPG